MRTFGLVGIQKNAAWVRALLCKLQKSVQSTRSASDKVYQLIAHGRRFSQGTPASSTTKTARHDITESGVKHNKSNQIKFKYFSQLFDHSDLAPPNIDQLHFLFKVHLDWNR